MKSLVTIVILLVCTTPLLADPWADEVVSVTYGPGAGFGQGSVFPSNILGPPDTSAAPSAPASTEFEILSLGAGGEIVLSFNDGGISDGAGVDFTVFENPFIVGNGPAIFREVGIIAVSEDGEEWFEFPYDVETLEGLAGVTPTQGDQDPLDPQHSGGDSFDLAVVGLETARYVRITDAGELVQDNGDSFDLDAVAAIHGEGSWDSGVVYGRRNQPGRLLLTSWPNPFNARVTVQIGSDGPVRLALYNTMGRLLLQDQTTKGRWSWQADAVPSGTYLLRVMDQHGNTSTQRLVLVR